MTDAKAAARREYIAAWKAAHPDAVKKHARKQAKTRTKAHFSSESAPPRLGRGQTSPAPVKVPRPKREPEYVYIKSVEDQLRERYERYQAQKRAWKLAHPEAAKAERKRRGERDYHRPFVAIDAEGANYPGEDIDLAHGVVDERGEQLRDLSGAPISPVTIFPQHRTFLWGCKGWRRIYSATQLSDDPTLPRDAGTPTSEFWLGDESKTPLSSLQILEWLTSLPGEYGPSAGYPDGVNFVAFSFGYDATQIFKDIPYEKVWEITRKKQFGTRTPTRAPTLFDQYAISYLKGKSLQIWKLRDRNEPYKEVVHRDGSTTQKIDAIAHINIMDAFGFYQESFVKATASLVKQGYLTAHNHKTIERNKLERGDFDSVPFDQIKHYCGLELDALSKALTVLRDGFDDMGLTLPVWTGGGTAAGAFIRANAIKDHYSPDISADELSTQQLRAHHAYIGGRIELCKQGYAASRAMWVYDIASAYPAGSTELPSMTGGEWTHGGGLHLDGIADDNMLSMYRVKWRLPKDCDDGLPIPFYPFPYRVKTRGVILFPREGHAWMMRDDLLAGIEWCKTLAPSRDIRELIVILEHSRFHPASDARPYDMLPHHYTRRAALKRAGNILEKCIKLVINALYGKTVQAVGQPGTPPSCACPYYGAAITAYCRGRLLRAALLDPHAIVSFMTDGIVSTRELKKLPRLKSEGAKNIELGDWEMRRIAGGFFLMSGVYALIEDDGKVKAKHRGFDPLKFILRKTMLDFFKEDVMPVWRKPLVQIGSGIMATPRLYYHVRRYITAGEACASPERFRLIGRWGDVLRRISVHTPGLKRTFTSIPEWMYASLPDGGPPVKIAKEQRARLPHLARWLDTPVSEVTRIIKSGVAARCELLIPTTPAYNETPDVLSAPSVPEWMDSAAGLDVSGLDLEDDAARLLTAADDDTATILAG